MSTANIKVAVRFRPLLPTEQSQGHTSSKLSIDQGTHTLSARNDRTNSFKHANFDFLCGEEASQEQVFKSINTNYLVE